MNAVWYISLSKNQLLVTSMCATSSAPRDQQSRRDGPSIPGFSISKVIPVSRKRASARTGWICRDWNVRTAHKLDTSKNLGESDVN
jgi:hypothetical protein